MPTFTFEEIEFIVPDWILSALINGDYSGLDDDYTLAVELFIDQIANEHGSAFFIEKENLGFCTHNDFYALAGDCTTVIILKDV